MSNGGFAQQCKNLYDACQLPDVLNMRAMSMDFGGWDTHNNEYAEIGTDHGRGTYTWKAGRPAHFLTPAFMAPTG